LTDHPDHEQLAAFQAGDGDRRQRAEVEAHLAGCPSCAEVVASVERARGRLALLEEPDLPAGLHDRLAAAVEAGAAEAARSAAARPPSRLRRPAGRVATDGEAGPVGAGAGRRRERGGRGVPRERAVPWYRRPVAWGAAAVLLLAALVVVPLLDRSTELSTASGGAGGGRGAEEAGRDTAAAAAGGLPVLRLPGEVTAAAIRARLATDSRTRSALEGGASVSPPESRAAVPDRAQQGADSTSQGLGTSAPTPQTGSASVPACLVAATAAADPALRPLNPAFFVEGTYRGRQATVLVTTSAAQPGRADLWVFPRNDCSAAPQATERVR
jgi:hypothetical protein